MKMVNKELHPAQDKLLKLIIQNINEPLTIREMQDILNISSPSVVLHHIKQLETKGYLKRNPSNPRDYQIIKDGPEKQIAYLNLYGLAQCGPGGNFLDGNPIERIPVPTRLLTFPSSDAFLVKAKGNSMYPKIKNGDYVIACKAKKVKNGSIVVCVNNEQPMIKKFEKNENKIILLSTNQEYPSIIASNDFHLIGEVKGIYSNNIE